MMKVGILGWAHGHVQAYCNVWKERPELDVQVVGSWDHDAKRLADTAGNHGHTGYENAADLLKAVDAVVISSETSLHADLVEQAAAAGKAIVLQKPMALRLGQADRIVAAVEKAGVPFTMAWQMRTDPQNTWIKQKIESGDLGKVFQVRRRHSLSTHVWPGFADTWHNNPDYNRDIWADDSSHPTDFINWLLGAPESVTAEIETLFDPKVGSDNGIAIFRYAGGPLAEVVCSFTCVAHENTTEVVAEKGTIIQNYGDGPSNNWPHTHGAKGLRYFQDGEWHEVDIPSPAGHGARIAGLAEPISLFLHGKRGPICTAEEGRISLRMILATYVSSRNGVRVSPFDPRCAEV